MCNHVDEMNNFVRRKKPDNKECALYDSIYIEFWKTGCDL